MEVFFFQGGDGKRGVEGVRGVGDGDKKTGHKKTPMEAIILGKRLTHFLVFQLENPQPKPWCSFRMAM